MGKDKKQIFNRFDDHHIVRLSSTMWSYSYGRVIDNILPDSCTCCFHLCCFSTCHTAPLNINDVIGREYGCICFCFYRNSTIVINAAVQSTLSISAANKCVGWNWKSTGKYQWCGINIKIEGLKGFTVFFSNCLTRFLKLCQNVLLHTQNPKLHTTCKTLDLSCQSKR